MSVNTYPAELQSTHRDIISKISKFRLFHYFIETFLFSKSYPINLQFLAIIPLKGPQHFVILNHLTPNGHYMGRTAQLTSRCCILYIYSTNVHTEYFKHAAYSPFFPLQNAVYFITLPCLVPVLFAF